MDVSTAVLRHQASSPITCAGKDVEVAGKWIPEKAQHLGVGFSQEKSLNEGQHLHVGAGRVSHESQEENGDRLVQAFDKSPEVAPENMFLECGQDGTAQKVVRCSLEPPWRQSKFFSLEGRSWFLSRPSCPTSNHHAADELCSDTTSRSCSIGRQALGRPLEGLVETDDQGKAINGCATLSKLMELLDLCLKGTLLGNQPRPRNTKQIVKAPLRNSKIRK
mmetsp:Transcript_88683/g.185377  ORF Transcript_88683/g.185377 Transcript_88683/m.185377 type:complete len:220 (-) Transcript_88683:197-856(-)